MFKALAFLPFITNTVTTQPALVEHVESPFYTIINESDIVLDVPYLNQKDDLKETEYEDIGGSACGPASLTMATQFLGDSRSISEVIDVLPETVYVKGQMFYNLPHGAKVLGYKANSIENSYENIYRVLKKGYPVILNVQNYDGITGHAVVVVGIRGFDGFTAKSLLVHDPFRKEYVEFKYIDEETLLQPEGYKLPIGILKPFYITKN